VDYGTASEELSRHQVAAIKSGAVGRNSVDLFCRVRTPDETVSGSATGVAANANDLAVTGGPLALNSKKSGSKVEDQVVSLIAERP
jgi:hypothetical protein